MSKSWINSLAIELRIARVIYEQAQAGWLFNKSKCGEYIEYLDTTMKSIHSELKPSLPVNVKQFGVCVEEPFKMDGSSKKMVTDWITDKVSGPFTRIYYEDMNLSSDPQVKAFLLKGTPSEEAIELYSHITWRKD